MPPLRTTIPTVIPAKPIKSERTHEENQERAYIAASRRSDRSLEARVESARRASEIHKRRTGRSLRVTEQDVVNEEMYEEEDDNLPMQYRRLTAHLQTSNADFDRRLAAYLTNHVAMRTALGQAVTDSYTKPQYTNAPQFMNASGQVPSPSLNSLLSNQQPTVGNFNNVNPSSSTPYSAATQQGFQSAMHGRSASVANNMGLPSFTSRSDQDKRRTSGPMYGMPQHQAGSPTGVRSGSSTNLADLKLEAASMLRPSTHTSQRSSPMPQRPSGFPAALNINDIDFSGLSANGPFSTALPLGSQQLLGVGAFDPNDPLTSMLMGQPQQAQPFYSYNPNVTTKKASDASSSGINQTLSPGVLDTSSMPGLGLDGMNPSSALDETPFPFNCDGEFNTGFDPSYIDTFNPCELNVSGNTTPLATPSFEKDWQDLFDGNVLEEQPSSQQPAVA